VLKCWVTLRHQITKKIKIKFTTSIKYKEKLNNVLRTLVSVLRTLDKE